MANPGLHDPWLHEHAFATVRDDPAQLDALATKRAVLLATMSWVPHPKDDYPTWRKRWGGVVDLVAEIDRMVLVAG